MYMKLTIGMACYDDYNGVYMTIGALRKYQNLRNCEIIVIDNNPESEDGRALKSFIEVATSNSGKINTISGQIPCRYIPFVDSVGPAQSKDKVFEEANGEYVLCIDSHVMLAPDAIANLKKWFTKIKNTKKENCLFTGPLLYDNWQTSTHFFPKWRSYMYGIWANAWVKDGLYSNPIEENGKMKLYYLTTLEEIPVDNIDWVGHESYMIKNGWKKIDKNDKPFEILGQGCGLFGCKKSAWLGFNPDFREFGGEEIYINEKFKQRGFTTYCLPFLEWEHRFYKSGGIKYPINIKTRFRNYVLGHQELGLPLDSLVNEFKSAISQEEMDEIIKDPKKYTKSPSAMEIPFSNRQAMFDVYSKTKSELAIHARFLSKLADRYKVITEISSKKESSIFVLNGNPKSLISYQSDKDNVLSYQEILLSKENSSGTAWSLNYISKNKYPETIQDTESLFIEIINDGETCFNLLEKYHGSVKNNIVINNTLKYAEFGENFKPGLSKYIQKFIQAHPEWFILKEIEFENGIIILSKNQQEKPPVPVLEITKNSGPGTYLKLLLKKIGIEPKPGCSCNDRAITMDEKGPEWCNENIDGIVNWLKEEHIKQKPRKVILSFPIPFIRFLVKMLIRRAIKLSERK